MKTAITNDDNSISHELEIDEDDFLKIKVGAVLHFDDVLFFRKDVVQVLLDEKDRRIRELTEVLTKVQQDVNWMTNEGKLLNRFVFDYIDKALNPPKP